MNFSIRYNIFWLKEKREKRSVVAVRKSMFKTYSEVGRNNVGDEGRKKIVANKFFARL